MRSFRECRCTFTVAKARGGWVGDRVVFWSGGFFRWKGGGWVGWVSWRDEGGGGGSDVLMAVSMG